MIKIGIICPSEIAFRRFLPALQEAEGFQFVGVAIASPAEWFGDSLSNIRVYSANDISSVSNGGYNIRIYGADDINESELKRYIDLVPEKGYESTEEIPVNSNYSLSHWFNTILKTTVIGKSLLIAGPILLILVVLTGAILGISLGVKAAKKKKQ